MRRRRRRRGGGVGEAGAQAERQAEAQAGTQAEEVLAAARWVRRHRRGRPAVEAKAEAEAGTKGLGGWRRGRRCRLVCRRRIRRQRQTQLGWRQRWGLRGV